VRDGEETEIFTPVVSAPTNPYKVITDAHKYAYAPFLHLYYIYIYIISNRILFFVFLFLIDIKYFWGHIRDQPVSAPLPLSLQAPPTAVSMMGRASYSPYPQNHHPVRAQSTAARAPPPHN
jgi:hypothetical protein